MLRIRITLEAPTRWRKLTSYSAEATHEGPEPLLSPYWGPWAFEGIGPDVEFDLPADVLGHLLNVDLDDPDSILSFIGHFGFMNGPQPEDYRDLADFTSGHASTPERAQDYSTVAASEGIRQFRTNAAALALAFVIRQELDHGKNFSLARVRKAWPTYAPWPAPSRRSVAQAMLRQILNAGLAYQALTVESEPQERGVEVVAQTRYSLFARAVLELIESLDSGRPYKRCLKCGQWFNRQEGRGDAWSRRDAVYCSRWCAKAAAMASYRARAKQGGT